MSLPATLTFPNNLRPPTVPTFASQGSFIGVPDLQIVFWGPYWPGTGQLSVGGIMQAVNTIVSGPYLNGLKQYGYIGPVNVRQPIVNTGNPNYTYPAPAPNVDQSSTTMQAVWTLVDVLRQNNTMGDVSSNHNLIVMVFIDPSFPFPQQFKADGTLQTTVLGAHSEYRVAQPLAPAIRFCIGWVGTLPWGAFSAFDQATTTFSHELAESISDPFVNDSGGNSGWIQTAPPAAAGQGVNEIGDICNNTYCVVDSIVVQPYWGVQQAACILSTEPRSLSLNQALTKHVSQDGPVQYAVVDMGPLCGKGTFDYVDRTWDNIVAVTAVHPGYQVPIFTWSVNGITLPAGNSTQIVPATWIPAAPDPLAGVVTDHPGPGQVFKNPLPSAPGSGISPVAHSLAADAAVDARGTTLVKGHPIFSGGAPAGSPPGKTGTTVEGTAQLPNLPLDPLHPNTATLRLTAFSSVLTIECGPGAGNVSFTVGCQVVENWDNVASATVTTKLTTSTAVAMANQQVVWGTSYQQAADDCYAKTHKGEGGVIPGLPSNPGDPGPEGDINKVLPGLGQTNKLL